jgi:hypothetical protein
MWQTILSFALTHYGYALPVVLTYLSTLHTRVDKSPIARSLLRILATFAGPLNWPHVKELGIDLARAIVAAADAKEEDPQAASPLMTELVEKLRDMPAFGPMVPAPRAPAESFKNPPTFGDVVKDLSSAEKERLAAEAAAK